MIQEMKTLAIGDNEYEVVDGKARPVKSVAEMKAIENLVAGNIIKTIGYYSANDRGGATYLIRERLESDVEDLGSIHFINDSLVAELIVKTYVTPEMFGAKGDGVTDDTEAVERACNYLLPVYLTGIYPISNSITVKSKHIIGLGAKFILLNECTYVLIAPSECNIENIEIDCQNKSLKSAIVSASNTKFSAKNIKIYDACNTTYTTSGLRGISISGGIVVMSNIEINNLRTIGNGIKEDEVGAVYGIVVGSHKYCSLKDLVLSEFHTIDSTGSIIFEDGGCIYIPKASDDSITIIEGVNIKNPGKYGIKSQTQNMKINNVRIENTLSDYSSGIALLPSGGTDKSVKASVSNCTIIHNMETAKYCCAINNMINAYITNCKFDLNCGMAVSNQLTAYINNCEIKGTGIISGGSELCSAYISNSDFYSPIAILDMQGKGLMYADYSRFIHADYGTPPYSNYSFITSNAKSKFTNCEFTLKDYSSITIKSGGDIEIYDSYFTDNNEANTFIRIQKGGTADITECKFVQNLCNSQYMENYGTAKLRNCELISEFPLILVSGGNTSFENIPLKYLTYTSGEIKNTPCFETELPTGTYPNGVYAFNLADGKLYKFNNSVWEVVGA